MSQYISIFIHISSGNIVGSTPQTGSMPPPINHIQCVPFPHNPDHMSSTAFEQHSPDDLPHWQHYALSQIIAQSNGSNAAPIEYIALSCTGNVYSTNFTRLDPWDFSRPVILDLLGCCAGMVGSSLSITANVGHGDNAAYVVTRWSVVVTEAWPPP
jgi:hypothetical protein